MVVSFVACGPPWQFLIVRAQVNQ